MTAHSLFFPSPVSAQCPTDQPRPRFHRDKALFPNSVKVPHFLHDKGACNHSGGDLMTVQKPIARVVVAALFPCAVLESCMGHMQAPGASARSVQAINETTSTKEAFVAVCPMTLPKDALCKSAGPGRDCHRKKWIGCVASKRKKKQCCLVLIVFGACDWLARVPGAAERKGGTMAQLLVRIRRNARVGFPQSTGAPTPLIPHVSNSAAGSPSAWTNQLHHNLPNGQRQPQCNHNADKGQNKKKGRENNSRIPSTP